MQQFKHTSRSEPLRASEASPPLTALTGVSEGHEGWLVYIRQIPFCSVRESLAAMTPVFGQVNYGENMGWAFNSKICNIFNTLGLTSKCPSRGMPTLCQHHAKTMPTHAKKMDNTGGNPPVLYIVEACVGIVLAWCWHSVGMPQLGHLLVRPRVLNILHIFELNAHPIFSP